MDQENCEALEKLKIHPMESLASVVRRQIGLTGMEPRAPKLAERVEYNTLLALQAGQSVTLPFVWGQPGEPALNAQLLNQTVRRVRERTQWKLFSQGSAAGLTVTRVA